MENHGFLYSAFIYLAAAVVMVPLAKRLGLGSVLGYLLAGILIGPFGLHFIEDPKQILHFAEIGVALLLFLIGLELNPRRLWAMRKPILGLGGSQVLLSTIAILAVAVMLGVTWRSALIVGMGLALSSTAIALKLLTERNLLPTPAGSAGFSVLLFQDIAVIPMLALIPMLSPATGVDAGVDAGKTDWPGFLQGLGVIAGIIIGGRYLLQPVFRIVAATRLPEVFTAFALLLVTGIAIVMSSVGMSIALGTFLAGVVLAESEYRHTLESEIAPFKGLLLGLFFIAVGMSVDFGLLANKPLLIISLVLVLVTVKMLILWMLANICKIPLHQHFLFACLLSQGGEFAFVLFTLGAQSGVLSTATSQLLIVVVALSMMTTPLLLLLNQYVIEPRFSRGIDTRYEEIDEEVDAPVIVAGFGRFGQVITRLLHANRIETTILDHDPDHIEWVRKFRFKVFYGEATRVDLLRAAGAEKAKILVLAIDDKDSALQVVELVKQHFPHLLILTRAHDVVHAFELLDRGVFDFEKESFEGALRLGEEAMKRLGFSSWQAKQAAHKFRAHDHELMDEVYQHYREDIEIRANITANARERLQQEMEADEKFYGVDHDVHWRGNKDEKNI